MLKAICAGSLAGGSLAERLALAQDAGFEAVEFATGETGAPPALDSPDAQLADGRWTITRAPLPNKCGTEDFTWNATTLRGTLTQTVTPACGASGTYPVTLTRQDQFH